MKLSSRNQLLREADEVLTKIREEIKKDPIWGYETLDDLRQAIRQNPKYKKYTDEEIDQMAVPWFIVDHGSRAFRSSIGEDPSAIISRPLEDFYLSPDDKKKIKDGLEQIRQTAIKRQQEKDMGQEPKGGYDEDLAIQRKLIMLKKGLPTTWGEKIIFAWKKFWTDNGEFRDGRTGIKYDKYGKAIPGSENDFMNEVKRIEMAIKKEKQKKTSGLVNFIKALSGLSGVQ